GGAAPRGAAGRPGPAGADLGRGGRALRGPQRGAPLGPPRAGAAPRRVPDAPARRRPPACPAAGGAAAGPPRPAAQVGPAPAAAAARRSLAGALAGGQGLAVRPLAYRPLEGGRVPVARDRPRRPGQGRRRPGRGLHEAVHAGQQRPRPERAAAAGGLLRPLPPGGWLPRPQAAVGLGGVPRLDQEPDRADQPGAVGGDEPAAAVAVPVGGVRGGGLVVPTAVAQGQGSAQRAGRRAGDAAAWGGDPATSVGGAGRWGRNRGGRGMSGA